jgi:tetratricopeptide (TPR) repeat protein
MQPRLLKDGAGRVHSWRAIALVLSALAIALSSYGALVQREGAVPGAPAAHAPPLAPEPAIPLELAAAAPLRVAAAPSLTNRPAALQLLREQLDHAPDSELSNTTNALVELGGPEAFALLTAATHSRRSALRDAAFSALLSVDTGENRDFMRAALNGPYAAAALGYFLDCRDPEVLPALERLARSPLQELSRPALDALLAQGARAEEALTRLLQADTELMDSLLATPPHTPHARRALRAAAISRLQEGAISGGPPFDFLEQDLSAESREALLLAAHDPASADSACTALARKGDPMSLAGLSQLANDSDPQLAATAGCALASDPDSRSRAPLERVRQGDAHNLASRALAHINAPGARAI